MKLIRALATGILLTGLLATAAPAQADHHHSRGCGHRAYYSHSHAYRPYVYYPAYDPYYYYSYRPVRTYSPSYYVAPRVVAPRARVYVHPHVDIRVGF